MGKTTGILWTDSTSNPWHGCTMVGPACDHCYAAAVDKRGGGAHWGTGVERRRTSENNRNEPLRWQRGADRFKLENGRDRRVFTLSMGDLFDNEVPDDWRAEHMAMMDVTDRLLWQVCTKRIGNLQKMVPPAWLNLWPQHIGVLITIVTQEEADRDIPKLLRIKRLYGLPWVGISYEPAQEQVAFSRYLGANGRADYGACLDWIIFGGKSGAEWNDRPFDVDWARVTAFTCRASGTAFFFKQVAAFRPTDAMIPAELLIREFPEALR